jgi:nucleoside 2-deoxyribosyltransferase
MLYLAGPYTHPDPIENTHRAAIVGTLIYEQTEWVPFIPHLSLLWHMVTPRMPAHWYELDLHQLAHCDAIVRLPGASTGADREMEVAAELGLRIVAFRDLPRDCQDAWTGGDAARS